MSESGRPVMTAPIVSIRGGWDVRDAGAEGGC
jgi:hypothetical protein